MARDVTFTTLKVVEEGEEAGKRYEVRVGRWNKGEVRLEKRFFWDKVEKAADGSKIVTEQTGKATGLNLEELKLVNKDFKEIEKLMVEAEEAAATKGGE